METVAIILINRDRPDITDRVYEQLVPMGAGLEKQIYVVECGSAPDKQSRYKTHAFKDKNYKGRYFGFNRGLEFARADRAHWDYYWFVVNDIIFPAGQDVLRILVDAMHEDPRMAAIGPGEPDADDYRGCKPQPGRKWHKASTIHGLAMLMRGTALEEVGYCPDHFHYSQGAGTVLAYNVYKNGWFLAYSDIATLGHAGGSTYGVVTKISRHEYQRRARDYASTYLRKHYGPDWDVTFGALLPPDVEENTFPWQKQVWEKKLGRNKKEIFPWFWRWGSQIKQRLLGSNRSG